MLGRNRPGQDGLYGHMYGQRRGPRSWMRDWGRRHPFITLLIGVAVLGWITWQEAARIEGARYTVAQGWGTGLAAGILASLGLTALWALMLLATRGRPRLRVRAQWPLAIVLLIWAGVRLSRRAGFPPAGPSSESRAA